MAGEIACLISLDGPALLRGPTKKLLRRHEPELGRFYLLAEVLESEGLLLAGESPAAAAGFAAAPPSEPPPDLPVSPDFAFRA